MIDKSQIPQHAEILSSDGAHIGTVDSVEGDFLKLTRSDSADGAHHYLPLTALAALEGNRVTTLMNRSATESLLQDSAEPGEGGGNFATSS